MHYLSSLAVLVAIAGASSAGEPGYSCKTALTSELPLLSSDSSGKPYRHMFRNLVKVNFIANEKGVEEMLKLGALTSIDQCHLLASDFKAAGVCHTKDGSRLSSGGSCLAQGVASIHMPMNLVMKCAVGSHTVYVHEGSGIKNIPFGNVPDPSLGCETMSAADLKEDKQPVHCLWSLRQPTTGFTEDDMNKGCSENLAFDGYHNGFINGLTYEQLPTDDNHKRVDEQVYTSCSYETKLEKCLNRMTGQTMWGFFAKVDAEGAADNKWY